MVSKKYVTYSNTMDIDGGLDVLVGHPAGVIFKISTGFWKLLAVGEGCFSSLYNLAGHSDI